MRFVRNFEQSRFADGADGLPGLYAVARRDGRHDGEIGILRDVAVRVVDDDGRAEEFIVINRRHDAGTPGLALFDWLVGIVGAVAFRLLICFKSKNAKKFRRDEEYGSARWGSEKDIRPFVDPKFENNMLLTATERLTMNTRPKNPANARNLNFCGIGSSGSGKTRFWLTPQLLQAHSSYVVVDPKGGVLGQVGSFLQKRGDRKSVV